jgi:hypothetical protein
MAVAARAMAETNSVDIGRGGRLERRNPIWILIGDGPAGVAAAR